MGPSQDPSKLIKVPAVWEYEVGPYLVPDAVLSLHHYVEFAVQSFGLHHSTQVAPCHSGSLGRDPSDLPKVPAVWGQWAGPYLIPKEVPTLPV